MINDLENRLMYTKTRQSIKNYYYYYNEIKKLFILLCYK